VLGVRENRAIGDDNAIRDATYQFKIVAMLAKLWRALHLGFLGFLTNHTVITGSDFLLID